MVFFCYISLDGMIGNLAYDLISLIVYDQANHVPYT